MNRTRSASAHVEYGLRLSDGSSWRLLGVNGQSTWVDRLASIMELKPDRLNHSPKLIFSSTTAINTHSNRERSNVTALLSSWGKGAGWKIEDPASFHIWCAESIPDVLCKIDHHEGAFNALKFLNMWYTLFPIYQRSIYLGGLPLHSGLVELNGKGVLLAASSDTGKSTCCRRLPKYWRTLCDDETLVVLNPQKKYQAHPFPTWSEYLLKRSEKTWDIQSSVPLTAICFIEQSETDEIEPLGEGQTAILITESATQICEKFLRNIDKKDQRPFREKLFNNACTMANQIPSYRLYVNLNGRFWEKIENILP